MKYSNAFDYAPARSNNDEFNKRIYLGIFDNEPKKTRVMRNKEARERYHKTKSQ